MRLTVAFLGATLQVWSGDINSVAHGEYLVEEIGKYQEMPYNYAQLNCRE